MSQLNKPSPAGGGRRLSELLEEPQEPFLLDVYLMEKGHSDSLPPPRCWSTKRKRSRFQMLKCMLAKFCLKDHHEHPSSPVSVLDLHSCGEGSPAHLISRKQFDEAGKLVFTIEKDHKSITVCHGSLPRELADEALRLTSSEISNTRRAWYELQPHVREIGVYVQEIIFQDIREDVILEMLGFLK